MTRFGVLERRQQTGQVCPLQGRRTQLPQSAAVVPEVLTSVAPEVVPQHREPTPPATVRTARRSA